MERTFENLKNEIIKAIKHFNFSTDLYRYEISRTTNKQTIKHDERCIDKDFHAKTELELVLRKFYSWDEIHDLENN